MRIGFDARSLFAKNGKGLKSYSYYLIKSLMEIDQENQYFLFYNENEDENNNLLLKKNFIPVRCFQRGGERFFLWEQYKLPIELRRAKIDFIHYPVNTVSAFYTRNAVLTLHDMLMFEEDIDNFKGKNKFYIRYFQPLFIRRVKKVITISNYSKERIVQRLKLNPDKVSVIYNGISDDFKITDPETINKTKEKLKIYGEYIFSVGANTKRKNIPTLIKAYLDLRRNNDVNEKLVISGIKDSTKNNLEIDFPELVGNPNVILLRYLEKEDLVSLYNGAKLFVFPSVGEGFGFPPLEAMACGAPVIASYYTSMPEVLEDAAYLIDTKDYVKLAETMLLFLQNDALRSKFKEKGFERIKEFSWHKAAIQTLGVYEQLYKENT